MRIGIGLPNTIPGTPGPRLAEWARARDWRLAQLGKLSNVKIYLDSELDAEQILEFGADRVVLATGAVWRRDGTGRWHDRPIEGWRSASVLTPDDVLGGAAHEKVIAETLRWFSQGTKVAVECVLMAVDGGSCLPVRRF